MHDVGKGSTVKLEWKPSRRPFNFGNFGSLDPPFSCNLKTEEEGRDELRCDLSPPSTLQHLKEKASQIDTKKTRILSIDGGGTTAIVISDALVHLEEQIRLQTSVPHAQIALIADSFEIVAALEERLHGHHFSAKKEWVLLEIESDGIVSTFEDRFSMFDETPNSLKIVSSSIMKESHVEDARKLFEMMSVKDVIAMFYFTRKSGLEALDIRFDEHASKVALPQDLMFIPLKSIDMTGLKPIHSKEKDLHVNVDRLTRYLVSWSSGKHALFEKILELSYAMAKEHFWTEKDVISTAAWLQDLIAVERHILFAFQELYSLDLDSLNSLGTYSLKEMYSLECIVGCLCYFMVQQLNGTIKK
ncbi:putative glycosyltransferase [Sesbania bispinosa]|nr:putative glycosyltransferase [Sesbania bispinosa]